MSGSTFGTLFRVTTFGESHGPAIGCVVDGCPPGHGAVARPTSSPSSTAAAPAPSRHVTQRHEADTVEILSGVYEGRTTGTPIALLIRNTDQRSKDYGNLLDTFRPGHADYTYWQKYGLRDPRGGGRASARADRADGRPPARSPRSGCASSYGMRVRGYMAQIGEIEIPFEALEHVAAQSVLRRQRQRHRAAARGATWTRCASPATRCGARIDVRRAAACRSGWASRSTTSSTPTSPTR